MEGNNERAINMSIKAGSDVNMALQGGGRTALMLAIEKNNVQWVNSLIKAGANVNKEDGDGDTALLSATELGHYSC